MKIEQQELILGPSVRPLKEAWSFQSQDDETKIWRVHGVQKARKLLVNFYADVEAEAYFIWLTRYSPNFFEWEIFFQLLKICILRFMQKTPFLNTCVDFVLYNNSNFLPILFKYKRKSWKKL